MFFFSLKIVLNLFAGQCRLNSLTYQQPAKNYSAIIRFFKSNLMFTLKTTTSLVFRQSQENSHTGWQTKDETCQLNISRLHQFGRQAGWQSDRLLVRQTLLFSFKQCFTASLTYFTIR